MWVRLERAKEWALLHERQLAAFGLLLGFMWDSLTGSDPGGVFPHISILSYFLLSAAFILLITIRGAHGTLGPVPLLTLLQFSFGNLASALFVLYSRSGTLVGSGIFVAVLAGLLIGNEFLRRGYVRTHIQIATWFFLFLPYTALAFPVFIGAMGDLIFLSSVATALCVGVVFIVVVKRMGTPDTYVGVKTISALLFISGTFTTLYFSNLIPPVPLSLTHIGVYHTVNRDAAGDYVLMYERPHWFQIWRDTATTYTHTPGAPAHCFTGVFAPGKFSVPVFHRWERYDTELEEWVTTTYLSFPISGGREDGYRGYTTTYKLTEGTWRCSVETERGALIGRITFSVVAGEALLTEKVY